MHRYRKEGAAALLGKGARKGGRPRTKFAATYLVSLVIAHHQRGAGAICGLSFRRSGTGVISPETAYFSSDSRTTGGS